MKKILITRSKTKSKKLSEYLIKDNHEIFYEPLFKIKKIKINYLKPNSKTPLIITSSNAIHILDNPNIDRLSQVYCSGSITANKIKKKGYKNVVFSKKNTAKDLCKLIKNNLSPQSIYYFRGEKISFDFKKNLKKYGYLIEDFIVYKTYEIKNFSDFLTNFTKKNFFDEVLIFSNNSLEIFYKYCIQHNLVDYFNLSSIICISQNVAISAQNLGFKKVKIFNNYPLLKNYYVH